MKYAKVLKGLVSQKERKTEKKQKEINNLLHSNMNVYTLRQRRYSQSVLGFIECNNVIKQIRENGSIWSRLYICLKC